MTAWQTKHDEAGIRWASFGLFNISVHTGCW